jgi:hypothetical protein
VFHPDSGSPSGKRREYLVKSSGVEIRAFSKKTKGSPRFTGTASAVACFKCSKGGTLPSVLPADKWRQVKSNPAEAGLDGGGAGVSPHPTVGTPKSLT